MVAISTTNNGVAMAALRRVNADLTTTQNRIATGLRVGSAKDDAGIWATATKIRSDISASESVKSNLSTAKAQVDAATAALDEIGSLVDEVAKITASVAAAGGTATTSQANQVVAFKSNLSTAKAQVDAATAALDEIGSLVDEVAKITSAVAAGGGTATTSQVNQVVAYTTQITALMGSSAVNGKNLLGAAGATNNLSVATGVSDGALVGTVAYTAGLPTAGTAMTELIRRDRRFGRRAGRNRRLYGWSPDRRHRDDRAHGCRGCGHAWLLLGLGRCDGPR
ncbi:hypothetical protein [Aureimonas sp. Leaf324]|uniref:flagellin N-terminal helical domain-containing protein n=1 Tax=Aureimonas sp. Leaf324 TaxID=1736336 RepID=UPI000701AB96|nr:hypothetical protein [Aureimonas sp. Leaf324]KQQ81797.1 hypothetical protein ASF65_06970 [Aureimonas sp. Leaf324]